MSLYLLVTLALLTERVVCHPSLFLVEIADDENDDIINNMMSMLQEAEIANKTLTEEEVEQLAQDYSDYCNCQCIVNIGIIYKNQHSPVGGGGGSSGGGGICNCNCNPCSGGHAHNGGGGGGDEAGRLREAGRGSRERRAGRWSGTGAARAGPVRAP